MLTYPTRRLCFGIALAMGIAHAAGAQDVHVGLLAPLSGPAASYGLDIQNGVMMAAEEIDAAGGIGGRHLVIDAGDDRGSPQDAANVGPGVLLLAEHPSDLHPLELSLIAPLVVGIILVGIRPQVVVDLIDASIRIASFTP